MNPLGIHALVWTGDIEPSSVELAARQTRAAGYQFLELSLHDTTQLDVDHARTTLAEHGLGVACSRGLAFDADISSDDPAVVERGARLLRESVDVAAALGARNLCGALYSALGKYAQPVTSEGYANAVDVLREVAGEAGRCGLGLGIEVVNRYETHVLNTAAQALRFIDAIGADNVYVHLDTYHMNIEETDLVQPVLDCADRLGYVHIGENHRGYLGAGSIDFGSFFHALQRIDYRGGITFESFSSAVVMPGLCSDLAVWRNLWSDGMDLASSARAFMQSHLRAAAAGE